MQLFILDEEHKPHAVEGYDAYDEWVKEQPAEYYRVSKDTIGGVEISTVFLHGVSHTHFAETNDDKPVLWETMIFGGALDGYQARYSSYEDAVAGHARAVKLVQGEKAQKTSVKEV